MLSNMHLHLLVRAYLWGCFVSLTCPAIALGSVSYPLHFVTAFYLDKFY